MTKVGESAAGHAYAAAAGGVPSERRVAAGALRERRDAWTAPVPIEPTSAAQRWLGATVRRITQDEASQAGLSTQIGLVVTDVTTDGPAAKAGVAPGDIITEIDAQPLFRDRDITQIMKSEAKEAGESVELWLRRNGENPRINLTLGNLAPPAPAPKEPPAPSAPTDGKQPSPPPGPTIDWQHSIDQGYRVGGDPSDRDAAIRDLRRWAQTLRNDAARLPPEGTIARFAATKLFEAIDAGDMVTALAIKNAHPGLAILLAAKASTAQGSTRAPTPQQQPPISGVMAKPAAPPLPAPPDVGVKLAAISDEIAGKLAPDVKTDSELENPFRDRLLKGKGAVVDGMPDANSTAARIGLQFGDLIIKVNGKTILSPEDAARQMHALNGLMPGQGVFVTVWRNDREEHLFFRKNEPTS